VSLPASLTGSERSWRDVVAAGSAGTDFSAPFAPPSPSSSPVDSPVPAPPADVERLDLCYMMPNAGMVQMEADLGRAVMVGLGSSAVVVLLYSVQYFKNQPFKTIERTSFLSSVNT
jgi:hypothetical protein